MFSREKKKSFIYFNHPFRNYQTEQNWNSMTHWHWRSFLAHSVCFFLSERNIILDNKRLKFAYHLTMSLMSNKQCKLFYDATCIQYLYREIQHHRKQLVMWTKRRLDYNLPSIALYLVAYFWKVSKEILEINYIIHLA